MFTGRYTPAGRALTRKGERRPAALGSAPPGRGRSGVVRQDTRGERLLPPRHVWHSARGRARAFSLLLFFAVFSVSAAAAAPPGAVITNQATLDYFAADGAPSSVLSNEVSVVTAVIRSPATVDFTRVVAAGSGTFQETVGPAACLQGGRADIADVGDL